MSHLYNKAIITTKVFPLDTELVFDMYDGNKVIRIEGLVSRVTPILSGTASIMGIKISGRTDEIKHIYTKKLNKHHYWDKITE